MRYCDNETSFDLIDDGTLDTVIQCGECGTEMRFSLEIAALWRDADGALDLDAFVTDMDTEHEVAA